MTTKYKVTVPPTMEQGSYSTVVSGGYHQTVPQAALQDYNSCRAHDGLPPLRRMPAGTKYHPIRSGTPKSTFSEHKHKLENWGMSGKKHCTVCGAVMMNAKDYNSRCPGQEQVDEWRSRKYYT